MTINYSDEERRDNGERHYSGKGNLSCLWFVLGAIATMLLVLATAVVFLFFRIDGLEDRVKQTIKESGSEVIRELRR